MKNMPKYGTIEWFKFLIEKETSLLNKAENWISNIYPQIKLNNWSLSESVALNSEYSRNKCIISECHKNIIQYNKQIELLDKYGC